MKKSVMLLAAGLLASSFTAHAMMGGEYCPHNGMKQDGMSQKMAARHQQQQKALHDALKLKPEQEADWKKFTDAMLPNEANRPDRSEWQKLTTPERADKMLEHSKQRQEKMAAHVTALKTFYNSLSPEQQKAFDAFHAGMQTERRGMMRDRAAK